jgi:adenylyltransferase/sulfurtransferase
MEFEKIQIFKREDCAVCGAGVASKPTSSDRLVWLCGGDTVNVNPAKPVDLNLERAVEKLKQRHEVLARSSIVAVFRYGGTEVSLFRNGRMLIKGAVKEEEALQIYSDISRLLA